jgi:predicted transcriptional regulator
VTQGGLGTELSVQPATVYGKGVTATGMPDTLTRGCVAVGCAMPACMQVTTAPWWRT